MALSSQEISYGISEAYRQIGGLMVTTKEPIVLDTSSLLEIYTAFNKKIPPRTVSIAEGRRMAYAALSVVVSRQTVLNDYLLARFAEICFILNLQLIPPSRTEIEGILAQLLCPLE
jgi:hypothetical protein